MRKIFFIVSVLSTIAMSAQELNCRVTVNAEKVGSTNNQVFKTLETALNDFVNRTDWTGQGYQANERINCSMFINVTGYNSGAFAASIQVQSARPIFNSSYSSPVLNFNDRDFNFEYVEFQNLTFNPNSYDSNLISTIAFYCYMMIGMDADTFAPSGGTSYFEIAQDVASIAQQGGAKGWSQSDGMQNRFFLINDMMSSTFEPFRQAMYEYHFLGLDKMATDTKSGKEGVKQALATLNEVSKVRPNAFLTRIFFDAKSDELVGIFSGGPNIPISDVVENLNRLSPLNASKWANIKF
ncbi:type IX secretion system protein PorD [Flavobacterium selenitireducens]|uniref:type IX secretion system protein PorD n=1 Tax=Flavobacterium selenitireducens TaxID=2722704 RepID=UPI00168BB588|nr:DUF4835 family protein [Flavobacterium selenitireducens]MBD3582952.1 DUF4835 family protein [Flavobacterium selenitireducens]